LGVPQAVLTAGYHPRTRDDDMAKRILKNNMKIEIKDKEKKKR